MISMDKFHDIRALCRLGKNKTEIAKELNLSRATVRKYATANAPPVYKVRQNPSREDHFAEFESFVKDKLELAPELSAAEIYALIRPRGYVGSERTIQRRVRAWKQQEAKERFFEQSYEPGEQAQFDFKECVELPFISGAMIVHLHFGTLPFSDHCLIKGYPQKNYECFMDGIHSFFESIGGMTENIRIDNLSPCVKEVRKGSRREYTEAFTRAIYHYGFGVLPCSPGKGNEKGDVERDIRTWARRFKNHVKVHGLVFRDFSHLNEELARYIDQESRTCADKLACEQSKLKPIIRRDEDVLCRVEHTRASKYGTVRMDKAKTTYSVPDHWIGLECKVVAGPYDVRIRCVGTSSPEVVHPRKSDGDHSILLEHVLKSLLRKPQAMVRWSHRELLFPVPIFKQLYRELKRRQSESPGYAEREFLRILNLVQYQTLSEVQCAVEIVLSTGAQDVFAEVKDLLQAERRPPAEVIEITAQQIPLNPNLKQYDDLIPAAL